MTRHAGSASGWRRCELTVCWLALAAVLLATSPSARAMVHDLTDRSSSWFNLQWPDEITHTISTSERTVAIYGQIWVAGATEQPGPAPGILAQVGYGPTSDLPSSPSWRWEPMTFNVDVGNNDEYHGTLLPDRIGAFAYATRYSGDSGVSWHYADLNGPSYTGQYGRLSVDPSSDTTAPSVPVLTLVASHTASVALAWTPATDDTALAGYELLRDGTLVAAVSAPTSSYVDSAVTAGQTYEYRVRAFDTSFNRSLDSNVITATATDPPPVPSPPRNVTALPRNKAVKVMWDAPESGDSPTTRYRAVASPDGEACSSTGGSACVIENLSNGKPYTVRVRARSSAGWSAWSAPSPPVTPRTVPGQPRNVRLRAGDRSVQLTWELPSSNGGAPIDGYKVIAKPGNRTCRTEGTRTCTMRRLTNGTKYTITVRAHNAAGWGTSSAPKSVTPRR
jgi:hypothetical protein